MAFDAEFLRAALPMLTPSPVTGEYYLTALLEMAAADGLTSVMALMSEEEAMGVNDRVQLSQAEAVFQRRMRTRMMLSGVTLVAPDTVFFAADTEIGRDTVIRPHVVFGPDVKVGEGCVIGPFAHIRPGSDLGRDVHIGNFVELKATQAGDGAKINHLSYVGDAEVGAGANIGAGTITCNYDGYAKHKTTIGARAFIGSNSSLVAPLYVGDGAIIGAGSVVTEDVPSDALYVERAEAVVKEDAAKRVRERNSK
jgi:bifunctional UDP-N-acetylglucosamine pyrophosphorylase/glucosamine-1-phosphate N-acetyltransferase